MAAAEGHLPKGGNWFWREEEAGQREQGEEADNVNTSKKCPKSDENT